MMDVTNSEFERLLAKLGRIESKVEANSASAQRISDRFHRRLYAQIEALIGLYRDLDGLQALPPLRNWAISPDSARQLVALIRTTRPAHVVECGGGASSVLLGHLAMAGHIGSVTTLEHDPLWYELTHQRLVEQGLESNVDLVFSPLVERGVGASSQRWYAVDVDAIDEIDLVLVDGPPNATADMARAPAAPLLLPRCRPGCLFVVDDFIRDEEQRMVDRWLTDHPMRLVRYNESVEKWLAVVEYQPDLTKGTLA